VNKKPSAIVGGIKEFLQLESAGGIVLLGAAVLALIITNSPIAPLYKIFLTLPVEIRIGALQIAKPMLLWINDGLMAVFFLLVGLEIKRECQALLPAIAAIGGMVVPAAIYAAINTGSGDAIHGWAIPSATDIAFALGVMSLLGNRVPAALKVFLLAVAIFDGRRHPHRTLCAPWLRPLDLRAEIRRACDAGRRRHRSCDSHPRTRRRVAAAGS
jgi:NhaA family Na+:H+ antiporter